MLLKLPPKPGLKPHSASGEIVASGRPRYMTVLDQFNVVVYVTIGVNPEHNSVDPDISLGSRHKSMNLQGRDSHRSRDR